MLSALNKNAIYRGVVAVLWFLLLVGLPLTSFPVLSRLTGAIVAPFSAIPLGILIVIWLLPYLLEHRLFPIEVVPLFYFVLVSLVITALGFFLHGYYDLGRDFFDQSLRAYITVAIGLSFYLFFSVFHQSESTIRRTILFIYVGGILLIIWTIIEVVLLRNVARAFHLPRSFLAVRSTLAVQSPSMLFTNRVTGFAYEPSWFVRQLNLVLFPILLAAVFLRQSVLKFRLWVFQVEDFLMIAGLVVFGFSSPRIGLVALFASLAYLGFLLLQRLHRLFTQWFLIRLKTPPKRLFWIKIVLAALILMTMVVFVSGALSWYIGFASQWDYRFELLSRESSSDILDIFSLTETEIIYRARDLAFYERVIFWLGGWNIFNAYPFGVGLGNAGFYFMDRMHGAALESLEMRNLTYRANYLANTKNLWTRLLSETGFIGLALFLVWLYLLWRSAGLCRKYGSKIIQVVGLAGQLFLLAFLVEGFSMDSFAMPYEWVMAGLISAGGVLVRRKLVVMDRPQASVSVQP